MTGGKTVTESLVKQVIQERVAELQGGAAPTGSFKKPPRFLKPS